MKNIKKTFLLLFTFCLTTITTLAQDAQTSYTDKKKDWGFSITPYAFLASQSTDVGGEKLRQSFSDLTSITNGGFQIYTLARYKKLSFSFDGTFANLEDKATQGPLSVKLNINQNILDFKLGYMLFEDFKFEQDEVLKGWTLNANIGAQYWKNKVGVDYTLIFNDIVLDNGKINELESWWDLMLGIKTNFIISKKFMLSVSGDVGGFGIGNSSKFVYDFTYLNSFKISKLIVINAGFRNFYYSRTDGEGEEELSTKVNVLGPILGVSFVL